jgi:hypothetical protein
MTGGRGRAVAGDVAGLGGDHVHELRAHVLKRLRELDLLADRHAVLGNARRAIALLQHDILPARPERGFHRAGQL